MMIFFFIQFFFACSSILVCILWRGSNGKTLSKLLIVKSLPVYEHMDESRLFFSKLCPSHEKTVSKIKKEKETKY